MKNWFLLFIFSEIWASNFNIIIEDELAEPFSFIINKDELKEIATRIWANECGKSKDLKIKNLIHWNKNEDHASVGIMHFTWSRYPVLNDQFSLLREYIKRESGLTLPKKLNGFCPWKSREDLLKNFDGELAKALREYLMKTVILQAKFVILERFKNSLNKMYEMATSLEEKYHIQEQFYRLLKCPKGLFVLVDTLNLSGEKGLFNALLKMHGTGSCQQALEKFVDVRIERFHYLVDNNPKLAIFINGWENRVKDYLVNV